VIPRLARACRREKVDRTPMWLMRQAGRYLPEYRKVREKHSLLDICAEAELTTRVTLQPLERFDLDAAIIFADILLPLVPMGVEVDFVPGKGPVIHNPVTSLADVEALTPFDPREHLEPTLVAIGAVRSELAEDVAVIGFAGAPFTLASYLIEGGPTKSFAKVKAFMSQEQEAFAALMSKLAGASAEWLQAQGEAGADVVQLFDSWAGCLDAAAYRGQVLEHSRSIFDELKSADRPTIHFAVGAPHLVEALAEAGSDTLGVDWRIPIDDAWNRLGTDRPIQGNLEPTALLAPEQHLRSAVNDVMRRAAGRPGHIFNLGHGVLPATDPDSVTIAVDAVRAFEAALG
jgi:uroporphyrinogen decarboxylase